MAEITTSLGHGYLGSANLQTSTANQEIIPSPPSGWTTGYKFYKFTFYNDQDCHISINGGESIFIRATHGFNTTEVDEEITSLKVVEAGITFNWIGAY